MQDQEPQAQDWQQPAPSTAQGLYQPIQAAPATDAAAPAAPEPAPSQPETPPATPVQPAATPVDGNSAASIDTPVNSAASDAYISEEPVTTDNPAADAADPNEDPGGDLMPDEILVRWQAPEYVQQNHEMVWYVGFGAVVLALIAVAIFVFKSPTFAVLVPVMAVALVLYVRRPPTTIDYIVSRKGIYINDRLYTFDQFKAFGVVAQEAGNYVTLTPRKRFQLGLHIYFPADIGENLVDMLAARLPMKETKPDIVDRLLAKLRL